MRVYLDESYDHDHSYFILGALFDPPSSTIHEDFVAAKRQLGYVDPDGESREIKYSTTRSHYHFKVASRAVDCFRSSPSWFRAIVIDQRPQAACDLNYFGNRSEPKAMKEARAYKKFTEMLLSNNTSNMTNSVLLTDRMTRCRGDAFLSLITDLFGRAGAGFSGSTAPIFRHVQEVDTAREQFHVGQIGDILQGVILNELLPTKNRYKQKIREYVKQELAIPSLARAYWDSVPLWKRNQQHPKYQVWYWRPQY